MEITLPSDGCNVYSGTYIDNYYNHVRTRYYLNENQLIKSSTASYTNLPTGTVCMDSNLVYKPEIEVYFNVISIISAIFIFVFAIRLILYPFWRKIR